VLVLALAGRQHFARFYLVSWMAERWWPISAPVFRHLIDLHPGFYESNRGLEDPVAPHADTGLQSSFGLYVSIALRNAIDDAGRIVLLYPTNPN